MIDFVEQLLVAWGAERISPGIEVSIPSPLGLTDEGGRGLGGHRCLSLTEHYASMDRVVLAVEQALRDISDELGSLGRQLALVAEVRYARSPALPVAAQQQRLGMSRDVYRARLDRLHVEVAGRYPELEQLIERLEASTPASQARAAWIEKARRVARQLDRQRRQRDAEARRHARQIKQHAEARAAR